MSAKLGTGVTDLLDAVVARVPPPRSAGRDADLRLFLFDSWWDKYHGSINLVLVVDGVLSGNKNNTVVSSKTGKEYKVKEVGVLTPEPHPCQFLYPGQVGYLVSNMKVRESSEDILISYRVSVRERSRDWRHPSLPGQRGGASDDHRASQADGVRRGLSLQPE